jgi:hypothetical protein
MNPSNMDSSDLTDKDLDYERTIARARPPQLHPIVPAYSNGSLATSDHNIHGQVHSNRTSGTRTVWLTQDVVGGFVDVWELNTFHFFRSALFKPLIIM